MSSAVALTVFAGRLAVAAAVLPVELRPTEDESRPRRRPVVYVFSLLFRNASGFDEDRDVGEFPGRGRRRPALVLLSLGEEEAPVDVLRRGRR